jgi:phasin family protein
MMETMAKTTAVRNEFFDVTKVFGDFRIPNFDVEAMIRAQRRNFEALTQANLIAVEGVRTLAQRQAEAVQQAVEEASEVLRDWTQPGAPVEAAKKAFEHAMANARELNDLGSKASADVLGVIARRIREGFDEVRLSAKKQAAAE